MTAPPLKKPVLICANKRRYPDELSARAAAMFALGHNGNLKTLWVYPCYQCRGWHLTKRNNGIRLKVTAENPVHEKMEA
jgi:hypothetical protein